MSGFVGIEHTLATQARAANPTLSVFVSANAGSGKTHVLTERVVRLLLSGVEPARILCLTYTKAAAAEMSTRVFARLARWATAAPDVLADEIAALDGSRPDAARVAAARRLFAEALETPGGLKIQTIHAFCEAILHQFPLEANVPGHFEVLDETESAALLGEARRRLITGASASQASDDAAKLLTEAFATALSLAGEWGLDQLIDEIVRKRDAIRRHVDEAGGLDAAIGLLRRALDVPAGHSEETILAGVWPAPGFDAEFCRSVLAVALTSTKKTDIDLTAGLTALLDPPAGGDTPAARYQALRTLCLRKDGAPCKPGSVATKHVTDFFEDFAERLELLAGHVLAIEDRLASARLFAASRAALVLADRLERDYALLKRRRGRLDFEDLIVRTADLLTRSEAASWVHYKLDQGIDHVLIDEAQDTSPRQWQVMRQLVDEFFAGAGARNAVRTVFAVGDEKQSIYSFQGASPRMFGEERRAMERRARDAGADFEAVRLTQSFRTAAPVLAAVDKVFADPLNRRGVAFDDEAPSHQTARGDAPGLVEIWPACVAEAQPESRDWLQPLDHEPANSPANRLARRIAAQIGAWLGDTIIHKGEAKRLSPGDFIVLVRKRSGFVAAMAKALRDEKIAVAGADRLVITDHIAVKDLMALGRTVANFEDDLSLAEVLKSPLFDFSDDELMALALSREDWEPLSLGLRRLAGPDGLVRLPEFVPDETAAAFLAKAREALERLDTLRDRAGFETIFAFYARILGPEGGRRRLTARLGSDASEVIDAFLDLALSEEEAGMPGLDAFLSRLASAPPVLKREMDQGRGAVRIMTTHAAKGLEAPVVFLVDPGSAPFAHAHGARLMEWGTMPGLRSGQAPGFLWRAAKELANGVVAELKETEKQLAEEEYRRLLYVGMTRAADRLVICGTAGTRGPNEAAWLPRVQAALEADCRPVEDADGSVVAWRYGDEGPAAGALPEAASVQATPAPPRPLDLSPLPPEILPPRPLSPSSAGAATEIEPAEVAESIGDVYVSPVLGAGEAPPLAIRRGLIVHRLLQVLPELDQGEREAAAERFVAATADDMSVGEQGRLVASALAVLDTPDFAPIFAPGSRAEVSVVGEIRLAGRAFRVNGTIDRLAVTPEAVLIVDYKTNRPPPATLADVEPAYVLQLALYREILKPLYPDRPILAALLFTEAPRLIPLDEATMDSAIARRSSADVADRGDPTTVAAGSTERQPNASVA
ncbi:double-strand break repair helicase AddA [Aurantimonas endophytica]|uniref:DNA 3'-5' helicase n=1 Tax=Aurantimonas endophytica TaxID=1522175 RepID=A0A7W6HHX0_9HYPH|nr:double-strand break repair helicase AddA [Aurantimonas endophytica]MBB4005266.1 ATP-dependent helicase/nuclease subunit A [Aurantimonas endophytica]MCO6406072.1 double-strand break repair helicase AddA [Aurantimonas endophytica]